MMPSIIYETLANDAMLAGLLGSGNRIFELESCDTRPFNDGYIVIIHMQDSILRFRDRMGPRSMQIWVHYCSDTGRDYAPIVRIQNCIHKLLMPLENVTGSDEVRLTEITGGDRSSNLTDPAWKTMTRNALYGVLFDELNV